MVVLGDSSYGITPAFVEKYADGRLPKSLVYAGSCSSFWNSSMAMAYLGSGAAAYAGFSGPISEGFARFVGKKLFTGLMEEKKSLNESMCYATDPQHPKSHFLMAGNKSLSLNLTGIFNAGFELPALQGWRPKGDGRQVNSFCGSKAPHGQAMGLISTGLGFTQIYGEFSQRFCIPEGTQTMTFLWRYYSAELESTCGNDKYQDLWTVKFSREGAPDFDLKNCTVDAVCWSELPVCGPDFINGGCKPPSDCPCGSCYETHPTEKPYAVETGCTFDGESVMSTQFISESVNVSALAGIGPVTLTFKVIDQGQSTNDTAVLIDNIQFK
jgi:hypothetical protein